MFHRDTDVALLVQLEAGLLSHKNKMTVHTTRHLRIAAIYGLPVFWTACLIVFLNLTSPLQGGPLSILAVFVLIYLAVVSVLYALAFTAIKVAQFLGWRFQLGLKTTYQLVSVISLGPVFILALNTLGRIEPKDILFVLAFLVVACFYVLKKRKKPTG